MSEATERGERFRALHRGPPFVVPNPWDAGSARVLAAHGFQALATTSSGFAFTLGRRDGDVTLDEIVAHVESLVGATDLPVTVDLEDGKDDPARAIEAVAAAGAVGASIEDWSGGRILELAEAIARLRDAVAAAGTLDFPFTLTARAENHVHGVDDVADTIARLRAYAAAGGDVLYAPGLRDSADLRRVRAAVDQPLNVLALRGMSLAEIVEAGAQRISVGGGLAWVAAHALADAAAAIQDRGDFSVLRDSSAVREWLS